MLLIEMFTGWLPIPVEPCGSWVLCQLQIRLQSLIPIEISQGETSLSADSKYAGRRRAITGCQNVPLPMVASPEPDLPTWWPVCTARPRKAQR